MRIATWKHHIVSTTPLKTGEAGAGSGGLDDGLPDQKHGGRNYHHYGRWLAPR